MEYDDFDDIDFADSEKCSSCGQNFYNVEQSPRNLELCVDFDVDIDDDWELYA